MDSTRGLPRWLTCRATRWRSSSAHYWHAEISRKSGVAENVSAPADKPPARRHPRGVDERQCTATRRPTEVEADPRSPKAARTEGEDFEPLRKRQRGVPTRRASQTNYTAWCKRIGAGCATALTRCRPMAEMRMSTDRLTKTFAHPVGDHPRFGRHGS